MTKRTYKRLELAENQLEDAIGLFVSGGDRFSVISLAGAADVILCRLVSNAGKENFTEVLLQQKETQVAPAATIQSYGKSINDMLLINHLKHMDEDEDGYIDIDDLEECAIGTILKALSNYVIIAGREKDFVQAFLAWVRLNLDPRKYNILCDPNWKSTP